MVIAILYALVQLTLIMKMKLRFCVICGTNKNLEHHHVIPVARGGDDHPLATGIT